MRPRLFIQAWAARQRGLVLPLVLWFLLLLSIMTASFSAIMRTEIRATARQVHGAQARAAAEAGIWLAINDLLKPPVERRLFLSPGRTSALMKFGTARFRLRLEDEAGRVDLNTAHPDLLSRLFAAAGLTPGEARTQTAAVLDWRDRDQKARANGAEDPYYRGLGLPYECKDGPFNSIEELRLVAHMQESAFQVLRPVLTVHSRLPGINPELASRFLLDFLAEEHMQVRAGNLSSKPASPRKALDRIDNRYVSGSRGRTFRIVSEGQAAGVTTSLEVVVMPRANGQAPYTLLSWRSGVAFGGADPASL